MYIVITDMHAPPPPQHHQVYIFWGDPRQKAQLGELENERVEGKRRKNKGKKDFRENETKIQAVLRNSWKRPFFLFLSTSSSPVWSGEGWGRREREKKKKLHCMHPTHQKIVFLFAFCIIIITIINARHHHSDDREGILISVLCSRFSLFLWIWIYMHMIMALNGAVWDNTQTQTAELPSYFLFSFPISFSLSLSLAGVFSSFSFPSFLVALVMILW